MGTSEASFHYETYRRVPMNSATTRTESNDYNSLGSYSTFSAWSKSFRRTIPTTTYIDGTTMLNQYDRPYNMKDFFPRGKNRQKPLHSAERKNARDAYMSLLPADTTRIHSRPPSTAAAATTYRSGLPDVSPKNTARSARTRTTTAFDDDSQSKFSAPTTHTNNGWIRRYKSINESQILSNFLRNQIYPSRVLLKKHPCKPFFLTSSQSTVSIDSSSKRQLERCT